MEIKSGVSMSNCNNNNNGKKNTQRKDLNLNNNIVLITGLAD